MNVIEFKEKIAAIYQIADELGREFNVPKCTPDGHLLGAIGKIAAKIAFGLKIGSNEKEHNCIYSDQNKILNIQVRCTGRGAIALRKEPEYLIAIEISETGKIGLLFNGPGKPVWEKIKDQSQPQKSATKSALRKAQSEVSVGDQLRVINNIFDLQVPMLTV